MRFLVVFLLFVALPMALGPATGTVTRLLGAEGDHKCMCGMKRGTCGCVECERLEQMRKHDREHAPKYPVVKGECDSDIGALPSFASVAVVPPAMVIRGAPEVEHTQRLTPSRARSLERSPPPTPPPVIA